MLQVGESDDAEQYSRTGGICIAVVSRFRPLSHSWRDRTFRTIHKRGHVSAILASLWDCFSQRFAMGLPHVASDCCRCIPGKLLEPNSYSSSFRHRCWKHLSGSVGGLLLHRLGI